VARVGETRNEKKCFSAWIWEDALTAALEYEFDCPELQ